MTIDQVRIAGVSLRVPSRDAWAWHEAAAGGWEPETLSVIRDLVSEGDVVIDVGAYFGLVTVVAAGRGARVHSFEPDPSARAVLDRTLQLNPEIAAHVIVHSEALGASNRSAKLSSERLGNSGSSLVRNQPDATDVVVCDAAAALSECGIAECSLVKIAVEGAESEIVPRLLPDLRRFRPSLLLAVHTSYLREPLARFPLPIRGILYRLRALPRQAKLILSARRLGAAYIAEPNSGRWRRLRGLTLLAELMRVGEKDLLVVGTGADRRA